MLPQFTIRYKFHWCGPCEPFDDTKEETIIQSDGKIVVRHYDHHGTNGHYRMIKRAEGIAEINTVKKLYDELFRIINHRKEYSLMTMDAEAEIILSEPGLKISADASLTDGKIDCFNLIDEFMNHIKLQWEIVLD
ncbi:MAG: hypothetical protein IKG46_12255 [Solobacterium sp.]|nr:hypothetical protein [Solobacterium sp.]